MIALVEGASRKKTPNEIALNTLLVSLTIIFLIVVVTMYPFAVYSGVQIPVSTLIALLVCLIPTTIGGLLSAIGIAGMDRVTRFNVIAMSGKAVEACGDVDTMILDKTGTITFGNRLAADFFPVEGASRSDLIRCAALTSLHDDTPEGKSTLELARRLGDNSVEPAGSSFLEFTAQTRMSGVDLPDGTKVRKGASDAIEQYVKEHGRQGPRRSPHPCGEGLLPGRHASGGVREQQGPGRHLPEGYGEARHGGAVRAPARHRHQDHHVHRRQPPDRGHHRQGGRRGRLCGRVQA